MEIECVESKDLTNIIVIHTGIDRVLRDPARTIFCNDVGNATL